MGTSPFRLKETQAPNQITFIYGGDRMVTVGCGMILVGLAYAVIAYAIQHGMTLDLWGVYESLTDLIPIALIPLGTMLTALRQEQIVDGDRQCFIEANLLWSFRYYSKTIPREEMTHVVIQNVMKAPIDPEDRCDIWIELTGDRAPVCFYWEAASERMDVLAQRMATLLGIPLKEITFIEHNTPF